MAEGKIYGKRSGGVEILAEPHAKRDEANRKKGAGRGGTTGTLGGGDEGEGNEGGVGGKSKGV